MNTRCFRLIFSKPLGFLIPVAEHTRAQRKAGQQGPCSSQLKPLVLSLLLASVPSWSVAEIRLDPRYSNTNVITAPNGVPVIEIADPNRNGLSHNRFTEFDVANPGVIFNNSLVNGTSQLGGAVLRNPNLSRTARAILSEVTGNKPSSISGTLEVFGDKADILIAKGTYLAALRYHYLSPVDISMREFARRQDLGDSTLSKYVGQDGQWRKGVKAVHDKVTAQLLAKKPEFFNIDYKPAKKLVVASHAQTGLKILPKPQEVSVGENPEAAPPAISNQLDSPARAHEPLLVLSETAFETNETPKDGGVRDAFEKWVLQAADVFDAVSATNYMSERVPPTRIQIAIDAHKPITDALAGKGGYLAAMQYFLLPPGAAKKTSIASFSKSSGLGARELYKWITHDRKWRVGSLEVHKKIAEQLRAKRPDLISFSTGDFEEGAKTAVAIYSTVQQAAWLYARRPPAQRNEAEFKNFARMFGFTEKDLAIYVTTSGVLLKRPSTVQNIVPKPSGQTLTVKRPALALANINLNRARSAQMAIGPIAGSSNQFVLTLATPFTFDKAADTDVFIDPGAPPIISLDVDSDDRLAGSMVPTDAPVAVQSPEVIDVESEQLSYPMPEIKNEPQDITEVVAQRSPSPLVADAPVKDEVPVVRHRIDNTVPILQGETGEDVLLAALQPPQAHRKSDDLGELLGRLKLTFGSATQQAIDTVAANAGAGKVLNEKRRIKHDIAEQARRLASISGADRALYMESWMAVEEVPGMGRGVRAARDIPAFTVLAPYAGRLLTGDAIDEEWAKVGMNFTNYTFGTKNENTLISAFGDGLGNISSLVNKGDAPEQNNLTVTLLGSKLVYLMAERPIKAGEALLYDYGEAYDYRGWPKHPILVEDSEPSDESGSESARE